MAEFRVCVEGRYDMIPSKPSSSAYLKGDGGWYVTLNSGDEWQDFILEVGGAKIMKWDKGTLAVWVPHVVGVPK